MAEQNDLVVIDVVGKHVFVNGQRFYNRNVGLALQAVETASLETSGLVALTGPELVHGRIVAPFEDNAWDWMTANTGIYNVTDHEGRFGEKGAKVNVVAHGFGPLSHSQRILEALKTEYARNTGTAQLSEDEEKELLAPTKGVKVYSFQDFLRASEDQDFLKKNRVFGVVRDQRVLSETRHGVQPIIDLYDNSSALVFCGGRSPLKRKTPEGGEETVTVTQAYADRAGQRYNRSDLGVHLHGTDGGRVLWLGYYYFDDLDGSSNLNSSGRFVGGVVSAGGAVESPRSDAPEKSVVVPSLEQVLAVTGDFVAPVNADQLRARLTKLYQN